MGGSVHQEKEPRWWLYWLPNMFRYLVWPGVQLVWSEFTAIRIAVYFAVGIFGAPALKLAWNNLRPAAPISTLEAIVAFIAVVGAYAFLTRTPAGNDILGIVSVILIILAVVTWILVGSLPTLALYAIARLSDEPRKARFRQIAHSLFFGPLEWGDRQFFLNRRAGN